MTGNVYFFTGHDTTDGLPKSKYRPAFMDHFDQKDAENQAREAAAAAPSSPASQQTQSQEPHPQEASPAPHQPAPHITPAHITPAHQHHQPMQQLPAYQRSFIDGDFEFVSIANFCNFRLLNQNYVGISRTVLKFWWAWPLPYVGI